MNNGEAVEAIRNTVATAGYDLIAGRIRQAIEQEREKLETCAVDQVLAHRAGIAMLRLVLAMPRILGEELFPEGGAER